MLAALAGAWGGLAFSAWAQQGGADDATREQAVRKKPNPPGSFFRADGHATKKEFANYKELWRRGLYEEALERVEAMLAAISRGKPHRLVADRARLNFETGHADRAIADMEAVCAQITEPVYLLFLAECYEARGKRQEYADALARGSLRARPPWPYTGYANNIIALARIAELQGENPRSILSTLLDPLIKARPGIVPTYLAAGELALRKYEYGMARDYFAEALERDSENVDAMAGMAETLAAMGDPAHSEFVEKIREINPRHPVALRLIGLALLEGNEYDEALETIDLALGVNPVDPTFLGLKSAAFFLKDDLERMKTVQRQALEENPNDSKVFRITGRIASRHYRFEEAAEFQSRALSIDPRDSKARALYGFDLLRLGREDEGFEQLEKAFEADPYDVQVYNTLSLADTLGDFEKIEHGPFILQLPRAESPVLRDTALALLDEAAGTLGEKYDLELNGPFHIQIYDRHDDFLVRSVGLPGGVGLLGICFGSVVTMDSPSARPKGEMNWHAVLWHEFAHVVTLTKTKNRMSRWLSEGISSYEEQVRHPAWGQPLSPAYRQAAKTHGAPTLDDFETVFFKPGSPVGLMYAYFVSGEFVDFYVGEYGQEALAKALESIGGGDSTPDALVEASGTQRSDLEASLAAHLSRRFEPLNNLPDPEAARALSSQEDREDEGVTKLALVPEEWFELKSPFTHAVRAALEAGEAEDWPAYVAELKKAYALFPEYRGPKSPLHLLAAHYDAHDDRAELEATLVKILRTSSTDLEAHRRLIALYREDGRYESVAEVARAALGIDPFDVALHDALLAAANATGDSGLALDQLDRLIDLDRGRAADYRVQKIRTLMARGEWDLAKLENIRVLERLPHFWDAQQTLLEIVDRDPGLRTESGPRESDTDEAMSDLSDKFEFDDSSG